MSKITDALIKLEQASDAESTARQELFTATRELADKILDLLPDMVMDLPCGYRKVKVRSNLNYAFFLTKTVEISTEGGSDYQDEEFWINGTGTYMHGDIKCGIPSQSDIGCLIFSRDISEGLIDKIAKMLARQSKEAHAAKSIIESATASMATK